MRILLFSTRFSISNLCGGITTTSRRRTDFSFPLNFAPRSIFALTSSSSSSTAAAAAAAFQQPSMPQQQSRQGTVVHPQSARPLRTMSRCNVSSKASNSGNDEDGNQKVSISSQRALQAVTLLPTYLADARRVQKYHPETCPKGALQLGVAESQMLQDLLVPALNMPLDLTPDCIYYQPTHGRPQVRESMATYVQDLLQLGTMAGGTKGHQPNRRFCQLDVDGLVVGAGCNAVLENLCICLAEVGEAVLIPTPYYAAFEFDLVARASLFVQPVTTQDYVNDEVDATSSETSMSSTSSDGDGEDDKSRSSSVGGSAVMPSHLVDPSVYYPTTAALDAAYQKAMGAGHPPKILLLSHPHNPLGICYPVHVLQQCVDWCRSNQVHLISDEIYAGSIYHSDQAGFSSVLNVAAGHDVHDSSTSTGLGLGPYVHWVYAMSKDFALSGLRVGVAYSENPAIRVPMQKLNDLCQISSQTQVWVDTTLRRRQQDDSSSRQIQEKPWTTVFREENHCRLRFRAKALTDTLEQCGIPYVPPTAGLFCWVDLSAYLPPARSDGGNELTDSERERSLYLELVNEFGLLLTPGDSMRNEEPGFFRIVFTAASDDEFALALERLKQFAHAKNQQLQQ